MDYTKMTKEELEKALGEAKARKSAARDEMRAVRAAIDAKEAEAKAEKAYVKMSPAERAAIKQVISVRGIESSEEHGTPSV